jgi:DNA-binding ferritin-like protein
MQNELLLTSLSQHAALLQALRAWFHAAHHATRGTGFNGDHELYAEIYGAMEDYYDTVVEKSIGLLGNESVASPLKVMVAACSILKLYPDPISMTSLAIASSGQKLLKDYNLFLAQIDDSLKSTGELTLGLNDFHAATASNIETFLYKLGQRIKSELEN